MDEHIHTHSLALRHSIIIIKSSSSVLLLVGRTTEDQMTLPSFFVEDAISWGILFSISNKKSCHKDRTGLI